jgi:DNA polymerase-3 subunit delta'
LALKDIFCQERAISTLQKAFAAGKVPHAYIFAGGEGTGKCTTARQWSRLLLCERPVSEKRPSGAFADSCGSCRSCVLFDSDTHADFHSVCKELIRFTKNPGRKTPPVELKIDVIREFLIEKVSTKPTVSKMKVFVVAEAEKLNAASQNCLLKVLEEPPAFCHIVLLCSRTERLLPTTRSRCQTVRFAGIPEGRITEALAKNGLGDEAAAYFARLAGGSLGRAVQWARVELDGAGLYRTKKQLVDCVVECRYGRCLELADYLERKAKQIAAAWTRLEAETSTADIDRRARKTLLEMLLSLLRDAMRYGFEEPGSLVNSDQADRVKSLAGRFGTSALALDVERVCRAMRWIELNVNGRLVFEHLLLKLAQPDRMSFSTG